jgi:hypothetical protein
MIKRDLIRTFAGSVGHQSFQLLTLKATRLLDLACGRGGDIKKWLDETKLEYVKGDESLLLLSDLKALTFQQQK